MLPNEQVYVEAGSYGLHIHGSYRQAFRFYHGLKIAKRRILKFKDMITNKIKLVKPKSGEVGDEHQADFDYVKEFYEFLQGRSPKTLILGYGNQPRLSKKQAFAVIYYLQEHLPVFPDTIEKCSTCGSLYDSECEGSHDDKKGKFYCESCCGD